MLWNPPTLLCFFKDKEFLSYGDFSFYINFWMFTKVFIFKRNFGYKYLYEQQQKQAEQDLIDKGIVNETVTGGPSGGGY